MRVWKKYNFFYQFHEGCKSRKTVSFTSQEVRPATTVLGVCAESKNLNNKVHAPTSRYGAGVLWDFILFSLICACVWLLSFIVHSTHKRCKVKIPETFEKLREALKYSKVFQRLYDSQLQCTAFYCCIQCCRTGSGSGSGMISQVGSGSGLRVNHADSTTGILYSTMPF